MANESAANLIISDHHSPWTFTTAKDVIRRKRLSNFCRPLLVTLPGVHIPMPYIKLVKKCEH